ncbi:acyl carrier protein [Ereboglobus sp. PH5-5]|uniref:acyl carrier protein n=1 Tax=unclassified Ereboglobus TaxID=2626932 RepID=UPI0024050281|nr:MULTISPECIES: acyl carrier protein [unclassified Ereboglobus]MDF9826257.1 acyl carrier protein [Ereboglobus sp. PH5-10]MDF9833845.1 acyl carrier protein [Ereboglobus sp. PH5-5]
MSPQQPDANPSEKLSRYEPEVREAYARYRETGDVDAVQIVIIAMVREHLPKPSDAPITDEQKLVEDLGYDSLAVAEVVFAIEDTFGLRIETSEIMQISTVGSLKEFIAKKLGPKNE